MNFFDILRLALRNLREAKLRAVLTTIGVTVGVAVIVTMISFGLGLQRNTVARFQELDLFNEVTVYGRSLYSIVSAQFEQRAGDEAQSDPSTNDRNAREGRRNRDSTRTLDDAAIEQIAQIPGVAYVEPNVTFTVYARANDRVMQRTVGGARVPNAASRFREFAAGAMIGNSNADEAVVDESFVRLFGYKQAAEAIGQTIEFFASSEKNPNADVGKVSQENGTSAPRRSEPGSSNANRNSGADSESDGELTFFGLPLEDDESENSSVNDLVARRYRIVGVLKDELESRNGRGRRFRGLMPAASIYIPLKPARDWTLEHRGSLDQVALRLAQRSGALSSNEAEGYTSATVRVGDPVAAQDVVKRLDELGFSSFGLVTELDQIRTFFLIINSALGLLGGISLLVASFGIANTMIMSILERTREIGIMKAIGAEDREIKFIFFVEAAVIGLAGGIIGSLAAWGIDTLANHLAYRYLLKPEGAAFVNFFALPPYLWLGAILFAVVVSIIAALYPASRAARIDPVKALRHD